MWNNQMPQQFPSYGYTDCFHWVGARWVQAAEGVVPPEAVVGGFEGETTYIGRAKHNKGIFPGRVIPSKKACCIVSSGSTIEKSDYQVLCGFEGKFVQTGNGYVPQGALCAGVTKTGQPLYIGLVRMGMLTVIGSINPQEFCCYIGVDGFTRVVKEYEIFVATGDDNEGVLESMKKVSSVHY